MMTDQVWSRGLASRTDLMNEFDRNNAAVVSLMTAHVRIAPPFLLRRSIEARRCLSTDFHFICYKVCGFSIASGWSLS
jgi:hypothetical protein